MNNARLSFRRSVSALFLTNPPGEGLPHNTLGVRRLRFVGRGLHERIELQPWQPETQRTVKVDFPWKADTWYTMKLEVQSLDGGKVRARGKVWPKGPPEPQAWTIERVDPIGNPKGSPGLYADAPSRVGGGSELYYDNIKVYPNKK